MKLDLRQPLFVFRGAWNPAIFQPGWIARYLFNFPEGASVEAGLVVGPNQPPLTLVKFIGVAATPESVMIYVQRFDKDTIAEAETVSKNIFQALPHTPVGPFGVNFQFREENPDDYLYDRLKTADQIDAHFKVLSQDITTTLQLDAGVVLNFKRSPRPDFIIYDFNFHHHNIIKPHDALGGLVDKYYSQCTNIISSLYGITHDGEIDLMRPAKEEREINEEA